MGVEHSETVQFCGCTKHQDWDESGSGFSSGLIREWIEKCAYHGGPLPCLIHNLNPEAISEDIADLEEKIKQLQNQILSKRHYLKYAQHAQNQVKK